MQRPMSSSALGYSSDTELLSRDQLIRNSLVGDLRDPLTRDLLSRDPLVRDPLIPNLMDANLNSQLQTAPERDLYLAAAAVAQSQRYRRRSEGSLERFGPYGLDPNGRPYVLDPYGRLYIDDALPPRRRIIGGSRSWHPSPYVSEDEDDHITREEKAAKIRAEIQRRRQRLNGGPNGRGLFNRHSLDEYDMDYGSSSLERYYSDDEYALRRPTGYQK